jgi:hypothetical protein
MTFKYLNHEKDSNKDTQERIYYDIKIDNIQENVPGTTNLPKRAVINQGTDVILQKQSDYEMAVNFWNLRAQVPVFICPLESTWSSPSITTQTSSILSIGNPCVITVGSTAGWKSGERVVISGVTGLGWLNINDQYNITVLTSTTFSIPYDTSLLLPALSQATIRYLGNGETPFQVCYESEDGTDYEEQLLYYPDAEYSTYNTPQDYKDKSGYTYIYTFQKFIDMMNYALERAYNRFNAVSPGIHSEPIKFIYNAETGLIDMLVPYSYVVSQSRAKIFINAQLQKYFEAIQVQFYGYNQVNGKDFRFIFNPSSGTPYAIPGSTIPILPSPPNYLLYKQEYDTRFLWGNIKSILFTSSSIGCRQEYIPINTIQSTGSNTLSVLSYYDIFYDTQGTSGANWRQQLYFNPSVLKWIDLVTNNSLSHINIEIFFLTNDGSILPLYLPISAFAEIKLVFRKK